MNHPRIADEILIIIVFHVPNSIVPLLSIQHQERENLEYLPYSKDLKAARFSLLQEMHDAPIDIKPIPVPTLETILPRFIASTRRPR
jgi:hypothetical protein